VAASIVWKLGPTIAQPHDSIQVFSSRMKGNVLILHITTEYVEVEATMHLSDTFYLIIFRPECIHY
jgi:hypothetical protein